MQDISGKIISALSSIATLIKKVESDYQLLMRIIKEEHQAIEKSNLTDIEAVTKKKDTVALSISQSIEETLIQARGLVEIYQDQTGIAFRSPISSFGEITELSERILSHFQPSTQSYSEIASIIRKVKTIQENCLKLQKESKPLIEMNQYLLGKLLNYHREAIRLWQEIANQSAGTYNDKGATVSSDTSTVFNTKA